MITLSNSLSFLRIPLAFLFLSDSVYYRCTAIVLAMISDSIDGTIARRSHSVSRLGVVLDPFADKFFVYFALATLFIEGKLQLVQMLAMLSRDIVLGGYGLVMVLLGRARSIVFRSLKTGKVVTAFQFCALIGLVIHWSFSWLTYSAFIIVGSFALVELLLSPKQRVSLWKT